MSEATQRIGVANDGIRARIMCLMLAVILVLPIPLGNNPHGFEIALIALGIL